MVLKRVAKAVSGLPNRLVNRLRDGPSATLIGGIRHRQRQGKGTRARLRRGALLNRDTGEGRVYDVRVAIGPAQGRTRTVNMVEKEFFPRVPEKHFSTFRNPVLQFHNVMELIELNRREKLGLRINETVRLRKRFGRAPTLVMAKLEKARPNADFRRDLNRQEKILRTASWHFHGDMFLPVRDKRTGKTVAVLADFGALRKSGLET